jgi:cystathionine beta-synthase
MLGIEVEMKNAYNNILETVGNTPLVRLNKVTKDVKAQVYAKLEFFNPGGSVKDRIGIAMIEEAEKDGRLKPGGVIVEPTSGNTGVGLALVAAIKGYRMIFTIPDKMSQEKIRLLKSFGAEAVVTPTAVPPDSPESYYEVAKRISEETPNAFMPFQYFNPANPKIHYLTTGKEIWEQTEGKIDYFVCGMGTGGTISGVGRALKEKNPDVKIIGVDTVGSVIAKYFKTGKYSKEDAKPYKVEGIGEDFIPGTLNLDYIDDIITVGDRESFLLARRLAREEGILVGGSSGSAVQAALEVAKPLGDDKVVVVLLPDTGERYLSKLHSDEWMRENQFLEEPIILRRILGKKKTYISELVSIGPDDLVENAIHLMNKYGVSQLPVLDGQKNLGSILEASLLNSILENKEFLSKKIGEVMEPKFPVVNSKEGVETAVKLLKDNPAILVEENGRLRSILTKYDIIDYISEGKT